MTTGNRPAPFRIPVNFAGKKGLILLDQIRTLDKQRLVRHLGAVERRTLLAKLTRLPDVFAE
jgi:mRNA interferase MazF